MRHDRDYADTMVPSVRQYYLHPAMERIDRRRLMLTLAAAAFGMPLRSVSQTKKQIARVGYLLTSNDFPFASLRQQLRVLGYSEGDNIAFVVRDAEGDLKRIPTLVRELLAERIAVLVITNNVAITSAKSATVSVPIVMHTSLDPVASGYVQTLARPGGNITGVASLRPVLSTKRVEVLRLLLPKLSRLAILWDSEGPGPKVAVAAYEAAAREFGIGVQSLPIQGPTADLSRVFEPLRKSRAEAIVVVSNPTTTQRQRDILKHCYEHHLPSMVENDTWVKAGGLISYAASSVEIEQRLASYVDKVLKGAKPADLPIEQPTKFELALNLQVAKAIGLTIPDAVLLRATNLIK